MTTATAAWLATPRMQQQIDALLAHQQRDLRWHGRLPVVLLDRCWLRLQVVPVAELAQVLPPDSSADAPELVRYRELQRLGYDSLSAQERCWDDFGREACSQALRRYWQAQDRGNHGWTLNVYLQLLERYRQAVEAAGPSPLPLLALARPGSEEWHQLQWCWPNPAAMGHTCG